MSAAKVRQRESDSQKSQPRVQLVLAGKNSPLEKNLRAALFPLLPGAHLIRTGDLQVLKELLETGDIKVLFVDPDWSADDLLLPPLPSHPPLIFVATHERAALHAFRVGAMDYLLDPVNPDFLRESLARTGLLVLGSGHQHPLRRRDDRLPLMVGKTIHPVLVRDILVFSSLGNQCLAHTDSLRGVVARPLSTLEHQLDPRLFFRANRSEIINTQQIIKCETLGGGRLRIELPKIGPILIARRRAKLLRLHCGWY